MDTGCGLYCGGEDTATPWTTSDDNRVIHIIFLSFLIAAFVCNLVFTFNNIQEHRMNEEGFATTPITYDALFVRYNIDEYPCTVNLLYSVRFWSL